MSENESTTTGGFTGPTDDPSILAGVIHPEVRVVEASVVVKIGPGDHETVIVHDLIAASAPADGSPGIHIATDDMIGLVVRGLIQVGENMCDQSDVKYSETMPKLLASIAAGLIEVEYDEDDDVRQAVNLSISHDDTQE